ncbi:regucalcin-like [Babylonia areolata]|uniref:regucalcin-like n=1 Tax=Babylonia areolata TaxID=304850 RepID=UPI003FCF3782
MSKPRVEVAVKNACSTIGEGPHWDQDSSTLLYVDLKGLDVHRYNTLTGQDQVRHLKDTVSLVVPRRAGGYVVGLGRRLALLDWETGLVSTIQEVERDTGNRFNDGKCDPKGRLWAGTMGFEMGPGRFEPAAGGLYTLDVDGSIRQKVDKVHISNGLTWSLDNRTFFFIDSIPRKIYAYDFDLESGAISRQRTVTEFPTGTEETYGLPDGMTIDTEGKLWVACYGAGAVFKFDPETGKTLQKIEIPAKQTTSVCWGGRNLDELYVTTARVNMSEEEIRREQPLAGSVFKVLGTGSRGCPAYVYEG